MIRDQPYITPQVKKNKDGKHNENS